MPTPNPEQAQATRCYVIIGIPFADPSFAASEAGVLVRSIETIVGDHY